MSKIDVLALMIGSLCHDLQHPGTNNTYQINSKSELAIRYNDISVLESFHCSMAFQLLENPNCLILKSLTSAQYKEFRKTMISAILKTDMALHFELGKIHNSFKILIFILVSKYNAHLSSKPFSDTPEDRLLIVEVLLHSVRRS